MSKRVGAAAACSIAVIFISAVLLFSCSEKKPAEESGASLTVHYYRYGGDYTGWNLWAWPADPNGDGSGYAFGSPDGDGFVTARVTLPGTIKEFGVIARRSEDGNDWAEKDVSEDRFTQADEVWLVQNDPTVHTEKPDVSAAAMVFAVADSADTVTAALLKTPEDFGVFAVYENGKKLAGTSAKGKTNKQVVVNLDEKIADPSHLIILRDESGVLPDKPVTMRNILDTYYYDGNDLGLSYRAEGSGFKVWAPTAVSVSLALFTDAGSYDQNGKVRDHDGAKLYPMERDEKTGVWSVNIPGNLAGNYYLYRLGQGLPMLMYWGLIWLNDIIRKTVFILSICIKSNNISRIWD